MNNILVKDCMSTNVVTADPNTSLPEANRLMRDNEIRRLPVVDDGRLIGIISMTDVYEAEPSDATSLSVWEVNYLLERTRVHEIMTRDVITISPDASMSEAARDMLEKKIGGLPVVGDGDKLIGIITESDIFKMVASGAKA